MANYRPRTSSYQPSNPLLETQEPMDDYSVGGAARNRPPPPPKNETYRFSPAPIWPREALKTAEIVTKPVETEKVPVTRYISSKHQKKDAAVEKKKPSHPGLRHALRIVTVFLVVGGLLCIPIVLFAQYRFVFYDDPDQSKQNMNLVFWLFVWLLIAWGGACIWHALAIVFPYLFRRTAKYLNSAHRKYWRVFKALRWPLTVVGAVVVSWIAFEFVVFNNGLISVNPYNIFVKNPELLDQIDAEQEGNSTSAATTTVATAATASATSVLSSIGLGKRAASKAPTTPTLDANDYGIFLSTCSVVDNIQNILVFWAIAYLMEQIVIVYISIHYHYRTDKARIELSKKMQSALCKLYEASLYLHPAYGATFSAEDVIIRDSTQAEHGRTRREAAEFFQKLGGMGKKAVAMFGSVLGSESNSHFFQAHSGYATVEHALEHPASSAALAKRIWVALVPEGKDVLTAKDIAEVFGPHRKAEADECFKAIDENENGDIRLDEMVPTVVEAGRVRGNIYQGMKDINHTINTLDWIMLMSIAGFMTFFILVSYVPLVQNLKDTLAVSSLGLSFAVGRSVHEFLQGVNFILFKHPFDIGDRVQLYNNGENGFVPVIVTRISLLYVVFRRTDDQSDVQFSTERLNTKRIENLTRSGLNKEKFSIGVHWSTTFKDVELLKAHLLAFVKQRENFRDFKPELNLRIAAVRDLDRMEIAIAVTHKSNWSNDALKSARSSRFVCALIVGVKKLGIRGPKDPDTLPGSLGQPTYTVRLTEDEIDDHRAAADVLASHRRATAAETPAGGVPAPAPTLPQIRTPAPTAQDQEREELRRQREAEAAPRRAADAADETAATARLMAIAPTMAALRELQERVVGPAEGDGKLGPFSFIRASERGARKSPQPEPPKDGGSYPI